MSSLLYVVGLALSTYLWHRLPCVTLMNSWWSWERWTTTLDANKDKNNCLDRSPPTWPQQLVVMQRRIPNADSRVGPATTITYYDARVGANLIQIIPDDNDPNKILWDLELDNGESYYFYPATQECRAKQFPVGVLRRDWLDGATPLGQGTSWDKTRQVCGWSKGDFIDYYVDKETMEPTSWYFHTMKARFEVLYYKPNDSVPNATWFTPPNYCFPNDNESRSRRVLREEEEDEAALIDE